MRRKILKKRKIAWTIFTTPVEMVPSLVMSNRTRKIDNTMIRLSKISHLSL